MFSSIVEGAILRDRSLCAVRCRRLRSRRQGQTEEKIRKDNWKNLKKKELKESKEMKTEEKREERGEKRRGEKKKERSE